MRRVRPTTATRRRGSAASAAPTAIGPAAAASVRNGGLGNGGCDGGRALAPGPAPRGAGAVRTPSRGASTARSPALPASVRSLSTASAAVAGGSGGAGTISEAAGASSETARQNRRRSASAETVWMSHGASTVHQYSGGCACRPDTASSLSPSAGARRCTTPHTDASMAATISTVSYGFGSTTRSPAAASSTHQPASAGSLFGGGAERSGSTSPIPCSFGPSCARARARYCSSTAAMSTRQACRTPFADGCEGVRTAARCAPGNGPVVRYGGADAHSGARRPGA